MLNTDGSVIASFDNNGGKNNSSSYLTAGNSTLGMFDESGALSNSYSYTGYGSIMSEEGTTSASNSILWDGELRDQDTGLTYLRARWYSPTLMRFINADTVNVANLYNFGDGNPIDNLDPSGHDSLSPGDWIVFAVGFVVGSVVTGLAVADWWGCGLVSLGRGALARLNNQIFIEGTKWQAD